MVVTAQPVLQYANAVTIGTTNAIHLVTNPGTSDPTPDGANITWDFSSATLQLNVGTLSWVAPSSTPQGASYPGSNMAQKLETPGATIYNYFDLQPTHFDQLADGVGSANVSIYADPKTLITFPWNYQQTFVDNYTDNGSPMTFTRAYTAYGTLILPTGTYTNVVKMTSTSGAIDFLLSNPVSQLVHIDSDGSVLVLGSPVSSVKEQANAPLLRAFPNPTTDNVTVTGGTTSGTWEVADAEGRIQRQGTMVPGPLSLSLQGLAPGCYGITIRNTTGSHSLRVVKQQ